MSDAAQIFTSIHGTFYRAVDPQFAAAALSGSRSAGRYSRAHEPTLYLSSSVEGVTTAMRAHHTSRAAQLTVVSISVEATRMVDLRDPTTTAHLGIKLSDAAAPWQDITAQGGSPPSWTVRDTVLQAGADGLIDPSRTSPGLWHLVLFRWNQTDASGSSAAGSSSPGPGVAPNRAPRVSLLP